jgi:uncharacterized protein YbjT (DUF2867 family)
MNNIKQITVFGGSGFLGQAVINAAGGDQRRRG